MNLTKYFNFKYLLQNIKKSKMALTIFLIVVPMFTSLMIISSARDVYNFESLGAINILGMYVIPVLISIALFEYVYKKSSVDFMCSMPISRKAIFITNTVGGIVLILAMQLVTLILSIVLCKVSGSVLFLSCAFDIFIYQTIAYIFLFTISNLAMAVSGNVRTQIVVTLLITLLIPFSTLFVTLYNGTSNVKIMDKYNTGFSFEKTFNLTAPLSFANDNGYGYNGISVAKMVVLSVAYIALGYYAFTKRKMEIAGESFEKQNIHFMVKGLTLAPFIAILIAAIDGGAGEGVIIILGIIAIYYFIYDLITGKKVKFKDNFIALCVSGLVMFGAYYAIIAIDENIEHKLDIEDIASATMSYRGFEYTIEDQEDIQKLFVDARGSYNQSSIHAYVTVRAKNGMRCRDYMKVSAKMLEKFEQNSTKIAGINYDVAIKDNYFAFVGNEEKELKVLIVDAFKNLDKNSNSAFEDAKYNISVSSYINHKMVSVSCPIELTPEIFEIATRAYNRKAVYDMMNTDTREWYSTTIYRDNKYEYVSYDIINDYTALNEELGRFIKDNENEKVAINGDIALIRGNRSIFFTNKIDEVIKIFDKYGANKSYDQLDASEDIIIYEEY